jgi:chromosome segregation ATPase
MTQAKLRNEKFDKRQELFKKWDEETDQILNRIEMIRSDMNYIRKEIKEKREPHDKWVATFQILNELKIELQNDFDILTDELEKTLDKIEK